MSAKLLMQLRLRREARHRAAARIGARVNQRLCCHVAHEIAALALLVRSAPNIVKLSADSSTAKYANRIAVYVRRACSDKVHDLLRAITRALAPRLLSVESEARPGTTLVNPRYQSRTAVSPVSDIAPYTPNRAR